MQERRVRRPKIDTCTILLDAAEALMLENGYAGVTSRRLATKAGLKPQLVHYHFESLDNLFVALVRRFSEGLLERIKATVEQPEPMKALWKLMSDPPLIKLTYEIIALANHRPILRSEIAILGNAVREAQAQIVTRILGDKQADIAPFTPEVLAIFMNSLARSVVRDHMLGISYGHADALAIIETYIKRIDSGTIAPSSTD